MNYNGNRGAVNGLLLMSAAGLLLAACEDETIIREQGLTEAEVQQVVDAALTNQQQPTAPDPVEANFSLQLLHAADMEAAGAAVSDAPRFSAVINALRSENPDNTLLLSSGDNYIAGPFFSAGGDESLSEIVGAPDNGRPDIVMLNAMGFQASAVGNHEFDAGNGQFAAIIASDGDYEGAQFPYLSANLDFSTSTDLAPLVTADAQPPADNSLSKSTVIEVNGEMIGIVGATTPTVDIIANTGSGSDLVTVLGKDMEQDGSFDELAAEIQTAVDALTANGIDKIILLAHMQNLAVELALAELLTDVDIIVAGGSDSILADSTDRLRSDDLGQAVDSYPVIRQNPDGDFVAVVNTDGQYRYVGRLVVEFDDDGKLLADSIDAAVSGAYPTDEMGVAELGNPDASPDVAVISFAIGQILSAREGNVFGAASVYLNGRRGSVRTEETNFGNLTADANLSVAQSFDASVALSLKNGGGIRNDIGRIEQPPGSTSADDEQRLPTAAVPSAGKEEGDVSEFDISNSLSFNNNLVLVTVTASELKALLENGVSGTAPDNSGVAGRFPQVAGLQFSFDPNLAAGSRVRSLKVLDNNGAAPGGSEDVVVMNGAVVGDETRSFRMVTLGFLAGGGDGYPFPQGDSALRIDLDQQGLSDGMALFAEPGTEQDALAEFLAANFPRSAPFAIADRSIADDERIQNLQFRSDTVITVNP